MRAPLQIGLGQFVKLLLALHRLEYHSDGLKQPAYGHKYRVQELMPREFESLGEHDEAHEIYEHFDLMEALLSSEYYDFSHDDVARAVRLDYLPLKLGQLLHQLPLSDGLDDDQVHADDYLKDGLPQREDVLELLPLEIGHDELVEYSDLGEPHYVIEQIVVVAAEGGAEFKHLEKQGVFFVLENFIHL